MLKVARRNAGLEPRNALTPVLAVPEISSRAFRAATDR